jgi:hypothetical protein
MMGTKTSFRAEYPLARGTEPLEVGLVPMQT